MNVKNYSTLHHSNICNILNSFPDATSNSTSLFITPANLCMVKSNGQHAIYYGATNVNNNKIIVRDYDYDSSGSSYNPDTHTALTYMVCSTIAHEIGHLYWLADNPVESPAGYDVSLMNHGRNRNKIYEPQVFDVSNVKRKYSSKAAYDISDSMTDDTVNYISVDEPEYN